MKVKENTQGFIDLDQLQYNSETLIFLRKKLDRFTIEVFRKVLNSNSLSSGLVKTRLEDYQSQRKKYDNAFIILEYQGFIEKKEDGNMTPYWVTLRGKQLLTLLKEEKQKREEI